MTLAQPDAATGSLLLEATEQAAQFGTWCWSPPTDEMSWSDSAFRLFGFEPGEITPSRRCVRERAHPDDRQRLQWASERLRHGYRMSPVEFRALQRDEARCLRLSVTAVQRAEDRPERVWGIVRDVTDQRRAERQLGAHLAVGDALAGWDSLERGATLLLRGLGEALGFVAGTLWLPRDGALVAGAVWHVPSRELPSVERVTRRSRIAPGAELPGQAWTLGAPIGSVDPPRPPRTMREQAAVAAGLRAAIALPVVKGEEVLAVVELHAWQQSALSDRLARSLIAIGHELGEFLAHRRGELEPSPLTARQVEILQLAADGRSGREIAQHLFLSPSTVKTHFKHIFAKLETPDRASAVAQALRRGLIR